MTTAFATVLVVVNTQHVGLTNITKAQLFIIANAVWIAILPQLRFTIEPAVNLYHQRWYQVPNDILTMKVEFVTDAIVIKADQLQEEQK